jgi:hypothetical protein
MFNDLCKNLGKQIVDFSEKVIRKTGFTDKFICTILRFLHFSISIFSGFILLFGSKKWFIIVVIINIIVFTMFFIFHGCLLSKLEHRFTNAEFTVIDPLLMFLGIELTNENRYKYSLVSNIVGCIFIYILYNIRFRSIRFDSKRFDSIRFDSIRFDSKRFDSIRDNSSTWIQKEDDMQTEL